MALPAGRYGVTKEQLRKIKRLPINTIGMITETKEGIAIVEDGSTASQLITAGRQFWHGGKLYSADVDISEGAAIVTSGEGKNASLMPSITDQLPGTDAEKANEVTIARVENGSSPTAIISEGEQFYHNNILYTATQDIATTDTITPNTNCRVSDSVTEQIASLDAQKADNSVIGTVENGTNPTKSYAVGEHMIRGGKFCTVTVAVTTSSTWTLGGNYVEGDVASEFEKYIHGTTLTISNLNDLPLGMGYATFTGDATPTTGYDFVSSFICFGTASDRIVMIYRIGNKSMYFNRYNAGAWSGWVVFTGTPI